MTLENPPGVLNDVETDSSVQRQTTSALSGGRDGVCGPTHLAVSQSSTPGMSVRVAAGHALVEGSTVSTQGMYSVFNDAAVDDVAISPGDPTNPRRDIVGLLIKDATFSGSDSEVVFHVVEGTPAGSPSDPTLPDSFLSLARVTVDANESTSIVNADITDLRTFADSAYGTSSTGTAWTPSVSGITVGDGTVVGRYQRLGALVFCYWKFTLGSTSAVTGDFTITLPFNSVITRFSGGGYFEDASAGANREAAIAIQLTSNTNVVVRQADAPATAISATVPFTWATGDVVVANFWYFAA